MTTLETTKLSHDGFLETRLNKYEFAIHNIYLVAESLLEEDDNSERGKSLLRAVRVLRDIEPCVDKTLLEKSGVRIGEMNCNECGREDDR